MDQITGTYNLWLVALSFAVAILTSYTAVDLAARVTANRGGARHAWLVGGAIAMGSGIWCMHYIGMLAFQLTVPVYYHVPTVAFSLLASILASLAALFVVSGERMTRTHAVVGSLVMGAGISAMHYIGMGAMRVSAMHHYDPTLLSLSVVLAVVISFAGLTLLFHLRDEIHSHSLKLLVALILGLAIPVMHYTGMAAVRFTSMRTSPEYVHSIGISTLAIFGILGVTVVILGFALITSLIDKRISGQHLLLENERKMLRALIDHIPDSMYVKDAEGAFVLVNIPLARRMGISDPQELIGKNDYDFFPMEFAKKFHEDEQRVMLSGVSLLEHEEMVLDVEGNSIPMLTTKVPLRDNKGQITGVAGVGKDIRERKKNEEALRQAERKYRSMFDEALVGIFTLDPGGYLLQANPAMAEFLGYENPADMFSTMAGPLWASAASPARQAELMAIIGTDHHVKSFELEVLRKDGGMIWISSSIRAKYQDGNTIGFVGMFEDITERRVLREQLLQAQKLESVGQLAAGIAHEINTPVQYIGDNLGFLRDSFNDLIALNTEYSHLLVVAQTSEVTPQRLHDIARTIANIDVEYLLQEIPKAIEQSLDGVSRVAGLVGAMKEFSHPGTGEKVPLDLNHAIESTITVARNEWKYVADMKVELDASLPHVLCLPGEFNQVVLNMIVNAAHAIADVAAAGGRAKGLITIQTRNILGSAEIRIQDTGGGIPENVRTRIFDPFFTTKEIGKGTGQGLAIARSVVVDKHQGTIDFDTKDGHGTTFIIRLPCGTDQTLSKDRVAA